MEEEIHTPTCQQQAVFKVYCIPVQWEIKITVLLLKLLTSHHCQVETMIFSFSHLTESWGMGEWQRKIRTAESVVHSKSTHSAKLFLSMIKPVTTGMCDHFVLGFALWLWAIFSESKLYADSIPQKKSFGWDYKPLSCVHIYVHAKVHIRKFKIFHDHAPKFNLSMSLVRVQWIMETQT